MSSTRSQGALHTLVEEKDFLDPELMRCPTCNCWRLLLWCEHKEQGQSIPDVTHTCPIDTERVTPEIQKYASKALEGQDRTETAVMGA